MKIAIPLFEARVSPRFEYAPETLIVTVEENRGQGKTETYVLNADPFEKVKFFKAAEVSVVICGGISKGVENYLLKNAIQVIAWVTGEAQVALDLFLKGRLEYGAMLCPGRRGRWRFCCQGRGPRGSR